MESNTRINRQLHNVQQAADIFTTSGSESEGNGSNFHQRRFVRDTTQLQGYTETDSSSQASVELVADVFTTTASEIDSDDDERLSQNQTGEIPRGSADESSMTNVVLAADSFTTTESEGELDVGRRPPHLSTNYAANDDVANLSRSARVSHVADIFTTTASESEAHEFNQTHAEGNASTSSSNTQNTSDTHITSSNEDDESTGNESFQQMAEGTVFPNESPESAPGPELFNDQQDKAVSSSTTSETESDVDLSQVKLLKKTPYEDSTDSDGGGRSVQWITSGYFANAFDHDVPINYAKEKYDPMGTLSSIDSDVTVLCILEKMGVRLSELSDGGTGKDTSTNHDESIFSGTLLSSDDQYSLEGKSNTTLYIAYCYVVYAGLPGLFSRTE